MPRTRIVTRERKESLAQLAKRFLKKKTVITSIVLIVTGLILIQISYGYTDVFVTPNVKSVTKTVSNNSVASILFTQPYNQNLSITFILPGSNSLHYNLYRYYHINNKGTLITQYIHLNSGEAVNNTIVMLEPTLLVQGQTYALNMSAASNATFVAKVIIAYNITVIEHSSRYLGGSGLALSISGAVILAYALTRTFGTRDVEPGRRQ